MTEHFNNCPVLIRKPQVGGSFPLAGSRNFKYFALPRTQSLRVGQGFTHGLKRAPRS